MRNTHAHLNRGVEAANVLTNMFTVLVFFLLASAKLGTSVQRNYTDDLAVTRFREYIMLDTSKDENIEEAVKFWRARADELSLPVAVHRPEGKPVVVITWTGHDPSLPSIMLNSHMDVVSADEHVWNYPPFLAHMDEDGNIYGRGTQDTKDIGIQYLEAIRRLRADNVTLLRTVHMTLMPDEETGGYKGMKAFVNTKEFEALNIGFALDEGFSSKNDTLFVFTQDKRPWQMVFTIYGDEGHGFTMPENNAAEKANKFMSRVLEFRRENMNIQRCHDAYDFGKYTSVNVNEINGGFAVNVIPGNITLKVDMRLAQNSNITEVFQMIQSWMDEAGNADISYIRREDVSEKTVLDDSNLYWLAMKTALNDMNYSVVELVCPATTDIMNLRNMGIPSVGFAPKTFTASRIHGNNEYVNAETFLDGIDIYYEVIKGIGNVPDYDSNNYVA